MYKNELLTEIHDQAMDEIRETLIRMQDETEAVGEIPRRFDDWSDDDGDVLWWDTSMTGGEITESPEYIGSPLSSDWVYDEDFAMHLLWVPLPKLARSKP